MSERQRDKVTERRRDKESRREGAPIDIEVERHRHKETNLQTEANKIHREICRLRE
jgi:hypothetical protein